MNSTVIYIALCLILPIIMLSFYLEKRARRIVFSLILGTISAILAYYVNNGIILIMPKQFNFSVLEAPFVEEILKFIPVLVFSLIARKGRRGSAANAFAVGVGFCVVENFNYLFSFIDKANVFWIVFRCIGAGLMHSITTTVYGIVIYSAEKADRHKVIRVAVSLLCGMTFHCIFNLLVDTDGIRFVAVLMPIVSYICLYIFLKSDDLRNFLWDNNAKNKKG